MGLALQANTGEGGEDKNDGGGVVVLDVEDKNERGGGLSFSSKHVGQERLGGGVVVLRGWGARASTAGSCFRKGALAPLLLPLRLECLKARPLLCLLRVL